MWQLSLLPCSNLVATGHWRDKHAAVADLAGPSGADDGLNRRIDDFVRHDGFDLHPGQQRHLVFLASIDCGIPRLLAMPAPPGARHARHAELGKRVRYIVDFVGSHDALDHLHRFLLLIGSVIECVRAAGYYTSADLSF